MISKSQLKNLIYQVTGAAIEVHKILGPGLLESVYHKCLKHEMKNRGIPFQSEIKVPIKFKEILLEAELRCDFFIADILPVEIKAVDKVHPIHEAQILTYMNLLKAPKGLLINFNVSNIYKEGQRSFVNDLYRLLPD